MMPNNLGSRLLGSLLILALPLLWSCGGADPLPPRPGSHSTSGFELNLLDDSFSTGGTVDAVALSVTTDATGARVAVTVDNARGLKALYCELSYDPALYTPQGVDPAAGWGDRDWLLCLADTADRGRVHYGQVLANCAKRSGFTGTGTVATFRFRHGAVPEAPARRASAAPCNDASKAPLGWDSETGTLSWPYYHQGDYNQDGLVTVSDLTPLGIHYDTAGPFDCNGALSCVDGNSDGYITVSDITPIGAQYNSRVEGYRVFFSDDPEHEYPATPTTPSIISARTQLAFATTAEGDKATERLRFSFVVTEPVAGDYYWVRPVDGDTEGIPSNMVNDANWRQWRIEKVDYAGNVGYYCSLALDAADHPHISYFDMDNGDLKYAVHNGLNWQTEIVDSEHNTGWFSGLALDSAGNPHISYRDDTSHVLKYAYNDGSGWVLSLVDDNGNVGQYTDIAIDGGDRPCISYCDNYPAGNLKFARYTGTTWAIEVVDDSADIGGVTALALDSTGAPHLSYHRTDQLRYAYWDGAAWQGIAVRWFNVGDYNSIALDGNDHPHITCFHSWRREPQYSMYDGTEWHHSTIATEGDIGWFTSIALDSADIPHVSFTEGGVGDLYYSAGDGSGGWITELIDAAGDTGYFTSIALDSHGQPHIAYCDYGNGNLMYTTP